MSKYDELEALQKVATAGNWEAWELEPEDPSWGACEIWAGEEVVATMVCGVPHATYIAASANAVPSLIADVRVLEEALELMLRWVDEPSDSALDMVREQKHIAQARAALARVKVQL